MNQTKKLINSFHFVGVTSCHTSVKQRWMLTWLVACQVCHEGLQTWRMFSDAGLQATATGENGESHSKPLSLIYDLLAVQLDTKEEKWWQDDKRKLQRKTLREHFLSWYPSLPLHPTLDPPSLLCLSLEKFRKSKRPYFHTGWALFLSRLLKHETQMVCKCRLWFCLMYPGYKVQRRKENRLLSAYKAVRYTFTGQWTPYCEDNRKKLFCYEMKW